MRKILFCLLIYFTPFILLAGNTVYGGIGIAYQKDFHDDYTRSLSMAPITVGTHGNFNRKKDIFIDGSLFFPQSEEVNFSYQNGYSGETYKINYSSSVGFSLSAGVRMKAQNSRRNYSMLGVGGFIAILNTNYTFMESTTDLTATNMGVNIMFDFLRETFDRKNYYGIAIDFKIGMFANYSGETDNIQNSDAVKLLTLYPSIMFCYGIK